MKVGDYVRTDKGLIGKYNIKKEYVTIPLWQGGSKTEEQEIEYINDIPLNRTIQNILNYSPNIIDLIEVGDYINGYKVIDVSDYVTVDLLLCDGNSYRHREFSDDDIKSILTKEQFESMEYRIGE